MAATNTNKDRWIAQIFILPPIPAIVEQPEQKNEQQPGRQVKSRKQADVDVNHASLM